MNTDQSPDFIISGKAFKYHPYDEKLAKAFDYDWESLQLNRDKSMSDAQHNRLEKRGKRKTRLYEYSGGFLFVTLLLFFQQLHQIPLSLQILWIVSPIGLLSYAMVIGQRYNYELDYDIMARAIGIPRLFATNLDNKITYTIHFGKRQWTINHRQNYLIEAHIKSSDSPVGQYFVAYYTPRTHHLMAIEPLTLVQDYSKQEDNTYTPTTFKLSLWTRLQVRWDAWWTAFWNATNYHK